MLCVHGPWQLIQYNADLFVQDRGWLIIHVHTDTNVYIHVLYYAMTVVKLTLVASRAIVAFLTLPIPFRLFSTRHSCAWPY